LQGCATASIGFARTGLLRCTSKWVFCRIAAQTSA
jgi:hypothetical protein